MKQVKIGHFHGVKDASIERCIMDERLYEPYGDGVHKVTIFGKMHPLTCFDIPISDLRVFWAYRGKRKYPSPMIRPQDLTESERSGESDQYVVVFQKSGDFVRVLTCYPSVPGVDAPKEPATALPDEFAESVEFWSHHVLCADETVTPISDPETEIPAWALEAMKR